jgi:hypothetical protein
MIGARGGLEPEKDPGQHQGQQEGEQDRPEAAQPIGKEEEHAWGSARVGGKVPPPVSRSRRVRSSFRTLAGTSEIRIKSP